MVKILVICAAGLLPVVQGPTMASLVDQAQFLEQDDCPAQDVVLAIQPAKVADIESPTSPASSGRAHESVTDSPSATTEVLAKLSLKHFYPSGFV